MNDESHTPRNAYFDLLSNFLTYRISRLHGKLNAQASRILSDSVGVTLSQWRIIAFLGSAGSISASALVRYTAMDKGLVSRNVKTLIQQGLVETTADDCDNRITLLSLSAAGKEIFDRALPRMQRRQAKLQAHLSADDIATFRRVLATLEGAAQDTSP